ncbi:heavy metal-associated isoprenylated plant protein 28-like isoform X1 [Oryza brachyantha]|uniref:heavy metal-associated isoprenylated plant protein 28-like isoform X1 n=1 Tax=Oryza brachyantha TaxID=4533 RepID=UPI001ADCA68E|nr:heavy metal-associated isoprenylated plant protein 28-like isoform X1 [Oryza brachyantha]
MTIVEMQMNMDCDGCEGNVRKALLRLQGVDYVDVDRVRGKVTVTGSASQKKVLRAARRSGRLAVLWPSAYNTDHHQAYYAQPQPLPAYHHHHHHNAKPAVAARAHQHHYSSVQHDKISGGGGGGGWMVLQARHQPKVSSYNYHVHGYFDSDLYGYSHHHHHDHADVVPAAARSYFSDENPHACTIM